MIICDLKIINSEKHKYWTGRSNKIVLKNIKKIYGSGIPLWIRVPVIPGINDSNDNLRDIKNFLAPMKDFVKLELLAYHQAGIGKWNALEKNYRLPGIKTPSAKKMQELRKYFSDADINIIVT